MKKIFAPLILTAIAAITFASAQPGPGPQPNPWVKSGDSISYSLGGILAPSSVTGGSKGVGTVNASNLYINGNAVPQSVFGRTGAVTAQSGDYSFSLISGTAAATQGGTGLTSGSSGGVLYFNSTSTIASSAMLAGNQLVLGGGAGTAPVTLGSLGTSSTVLHGNASGAPTWGAVSLTADVSGTLPVANGGTGATTITGLVLGNGSSAMSAYTGTFCTNQFPRSLNASGVATCASVSLTADVAGILPAANGGTANGFTAFTGPTTSTKTFTLPNASAAILTDNAAVTVAQGGTGITSGTSGGVLAFTASGTIASSGALTANLPVIGGGAGAAPTVGTRSGNTTEFASVAAGAKTSGNVATWDASGNIQDGGAVPAQTSGSWTPTYVGTTGSGTSYLFQYGSYIKTGNLVYIQWSVRGSPGTMATQVYIGALPYPVATSSALGACSMGTMQGWTLGGTYYQLGMFPVSGTSTIGLSANSAAGTGYAFVTPAMMTGNAIIEGSCTYMTP